MADYSSTKPVEDDIRSDDAEYNPSIEPESAKAWLNLLEESEDAFEDWNEHCDNIDKLYASLERLSVGNSAAGNRAMRDREYQMFWANCEVMKPAIYANPPVPVVTPKFKDRRPVYQQASEVMERCCIVAFDLTRINDLMLLVRDDVAMASRGVAWCRYEGAGDDYDSERVCVDFKNRRDFLHSISRNWREVTWVAAASYLTRPEARKRFSKYSGDAYQEAEYRVDKESKNVGGVDRRERAKFWEIWDRTTRRVVWVAEGCDVILDEDEPHLKLQNYFPCPKPAYGTCQRGSLVPVPDAMQYRDQLDEINMLTGRIHALSDAIEVKGFYPAGGNELADAVEAAIKTHSSSRVLIPISNWSSFGQTKDPIIWMPIDQIATTIQALVLLRKQLIDDVYQITGMADIMRGDTDPQETLGAQQMKSQYGTTRIRDKQQELIRLARDLVEITSEIITEKFSDTTIIEMSQTQLPTRDMVEQQANQIVQQAQAAMQQLAQARQQRLSSPQQGPPQQASLAGGPPPAAGAPGPGGSAPDPVQQIQQQAQQQLQQLAQQPTIEQVLKLFSDSRTKSFVLDIETDSTIMADENAEKQRRTEFVGVLGQLIPQLGQLIAADPQSAQLCGDILKFATAPFRAGRSLEGSIDEYVENVKAKGNQPQQADPATKAAQVQLQIEQMKLGYAKQKDDADRQVKVAQMQQDAQGNAQGNAIDAQAKQAEIAGRQQENAAKIYQMNLDARNTQQEHAMDMQEMAAKQQLDAQHHAATLQALAMKNQQAQQAAQFKMMQPPRGGI